MKPCPGCLGEGAHDMRDLDAVLLEHFSADHIRSMGGNPHCGIVLCTECEGTGVVTVERFNEMMDEAAKHVCRLIRQWEVIEQLEESFSDAAPQT